MYCSRPIIVTEGLREKMLRVFESVGADLSNGEAKTVLELRLGAEILGGERRAELKPSCTIRPSSISMISCMTTEKSS